MHTSLKLDLTLSYHRIFASTFEYCESFHPNKFLRVVLVVALGCLFQYLLKLTVVKDLGRRALIKKMQISSLGACVSVNVLALIVECSQAEYQVTAQKLLLTSENVCRIEYENSMANWIGLDSITDQH